MCIIYLYVKNYFLVYAYKCIGFSLEEYITKYNRGSFEGKEMGCLECRGRRKSLFFPVSSILPCGFYSTFKVIY